MRSWPVSEPLHILWDWNGTLLDDTRAALDTLNIMLGRRHRPGIAMDFYRDHFAFPVRPFYESIGVCLEREDWDALAREYHDTYLGQRRALNVQAVAALEAAAAYDVRQSVVSALREDLLLGEIEAFGLTRYFTYMRGTDNLDGASKLDRARALVAELRAAEPCVRIVMIGDALHDHEVATALGVGCVLCAQGSHAAWRLEAVAPTAPTLVEAVALAVRGAGRNTGKKTEVSHA